MNKTRYIPKDSSEVKRDGIDAVVYTEQIGETFYAIGYSAKRTVRDFYYSFRTADAMSRYVDKFFADVKALQDLKAARKAEKRDYKHTFKVGDILESSWGYDQTNVDFYQVVSVSGKVIYIRPIASRSAGGSSVVALPNHFTDNPETDAPMKKIPHAFGKDEYVSLTSYSSASKWDGRPMYDTDAMSGH